MQNPIYVVDADLTHPDEVTSNIHVWYELEGEPHQWTMPGFDLMNWFPPVYRKIFKYTLAAYWYAIHPQLRNEHIAAYLLDRSNYYQLVQTT